MPERLPITLAAGLLFLLTPVTALASRGVAIDLGRIEIQQKLTPGGSYRLPTMGVRNPGTETTRYELHASPLAMKGKKAPPSSWFHFSPSRLTLKPNQTQPVKVRIDLPTGADPGNYVALVGPQIVTTGKGAQVGAAAASRVTFSVEPANWLQAWWLRAKTFFSSHEPWTYLVPALIALLAAVRLLRNRFTFAISRRHTPERTSS